LTFTRFYTCDPYIERRIVTLYEVKDKLDILVTVHDDNLNLISELINP